MKNEKLILGCGPNFYHVTQAFWDDRLVVGKHPCSSVHKLNGIVSLTMGHLKEKSCVSKSAGALVISRAQFGRFAIFFISTDY